MLTGENTGPAFFINIKLLLQMKQIMRKKTYGMARISK